VSQLDILFQLQRLVMPRYEASQGFLLRRNDKSLIFAVQTDTLQIRDEKSSLCPSTKILKSSISKGFAK